MHTKTGITDLFWQFWIELNVAENLPLVRTNKHQVIILFASMYIATNVSSQ